MSVTDLRSMVWCYSRQGDLHHPHKLDHGGTAYQIHENQSARQPAATIPACCALPSPCHCCCCCCCCQQQVATQSLGLVRKQASFGAGYSCCLSLSQIGRIAPQWCALPNGEKSFKMWQSFAASIHRLLQLLSLDGQTTTTLKKLGSYLNKREKEGNWLESSCLKGVCEFWRKPQSGRVGVDISKINSTSQRRVWVTRGAASHGDKSSKKVIYSLWPIFKYIVIVFLWAVPDKRIASYVRIR